MSQSVNFVPGQRPLWASLFHSVHKLGSVALILIMGASSVCAVTYQLGTATLFEGASSGTDSVTVAVSPAGSAWAAATNSSWLHLTPANQNGAGSTNIIFTFDSNPGATRTGSITISGQTLNITQVGSNYALANPLTVLVTGLSGPTSTALDSNRNVYIAEATGNNIKKWTATSNSVSTLVSNLNQPFGVAVDSVGNVLIADTGNNAIKKRTPAGTLSTLISSGLSGPRRIGVDSADNIYIPDSGNNAVKKWTGALPLITVVSNGLNLPSGVAVDIAGNIYIADNGNDAVRKWNADSGTVTTLVAPGTTSAAAVTVDGSGNVYIADGGNSNVRKWSAVDGQLTTIASTGLQTCRGVVVDADRNLYIANFGSNSIVELPRVFVDLTPKSVNVDAGSDSISFLPPINLTGALTPTSNQPWLTIDSAANGTIQFHFSQNSGGSRSATITVLGQSVSVTQGSTRLGFSSIVQGPWADTNSVLVVPSGLVPWTATANDSWLHVSTLTQGGTGNSNVIFSFDANPGLTRTGSLSIAGGTVSVIQAGTNYLAATGAFALATSVNGGHGVALDSTGNVYVVSTTSNAVHRWSKSNNTVTTNLITGLSAPFGLASDTIGNLYIASQGTGVVKWNATNGTLATLVTGLLNCSGVAVDLGGNVYTTDTERHAIKEWLAPSGPVSTLISSNAANSLYRPFGVAVDIANTVYIANTFGSSIKRLASGESNLTTIVASGVGPFALAVDGSGNVYIADGNSGAVKKWTAANSTVTTLSSGWNTVFGVAVDSLGSIYFSELRSNSLRAIPRAFVDCTPVSEPPSGGTGTLPVVLPATINLDPPFFPTSDQPWLSVLGVTNGVISFSVATNIGLVRVAHLNVLGQSISVTQQGPTFTLSTNSLIESVAGGSDSVFLSVNPPTGTWTATNNVPWLHITPGSESGVGSASVSFTIDPNLAGYERTGTLTIAGQTVTITQQYIVLSTSAVLQGPAAGMDSVVIGASAGVPWTCVANDSWLHVSATNQSGSGSALVTYTFDENQGGTRAGSLTVAGFTLAVTQAGSNYVSVGSRTTLSSALSSAQGVALDNAGNAYVVSGSTVKKWSATNNSVTTFVSSINGANLSRDSAGNLYIAAPGSLAIRKWTAATSSLTTLVSGLDSPYGVEVDLAGNVYFTDTGRSAIKKWNVADGQVTTLVASNAANPILNRPFGLTVDVANNVYIADTSGNSVKQWSPVTTNLTTLVSSGLSFPYDVGLDGSGNLYIVDEANDAIKKWTALNNTVSTVATGLFDPFGVAVDAAGNLFFTDGTRLSEIPRAFVDPSEKIEPVTGGSDVLPVVLPANINLNPPFYPTSDQPWLSVVGVTNGVISFSVTTNLGSLRIAHLNVLGQSITVTQPGPSFSLSTNSLTESVAGGNDSVVLSVSAPFGAWTATNNVPWLHIAPGSESGVGSATVAFSVDPNSGGYERVGTLTIGGQTLTVTQQFVALSTSAVLQAPAAGIDSVVLGASAGVSWTCVANDSWLHVSATNQGGSGSALLTYTFDENSGNTRAGSITVAGLNLAIMQAGSNYVAAAGSPTVLSSALPNAEGIAVDDAGNVYVAANSNVKKWSVADNSVTTLIPSVPAANLAADSSGNLYIASGSDSILKWDATNHFYNVLVPGLNSPFGVDVDLAGNVYFTDNGPAAIKKWNVADGQVSTVVVSNADNPTLKRPFSVAVDVANNVYIGDIVDSSVQRWSPATSNLTSLVPGTTIPYDVALDGSGNLYVADGANSAIKKWTAFNNTVSNIVTGLASPFGITVDSAGNIYFTDGSHLKEIPHAFVDPSAKIEPPAAGSDVLPGVVPANLNLRDPFTPTSDQTWLTITGVTNGVVSFSFAEAVSTRTAHINLLGQSIAVTQVVPLPTPISISASMVTPGVFQLQFTNGLPTASFTVLASTDLSLPVDEWTELGTATNANGVLQFTDTSATNGTRYYQIRSP